MRVHIAGLDGLAVCGAGKARAIMVGGRPCYLDKRLGDEVPKWRTCGRCARKVGRVRRLEQGLSIVEEDGWVPFEPSKGPTSRRKPGRAPRLDRSPWKGVVEARELSLHWGGNKRTSRASRRKSTSSVVVREDQPVSRPDYRVEAPDVYGERTATLDRVEGFGWEAREAARVAERNADARAAFQAMSAEEQAAWKAERNARLAWA